MMRGALPADDSQTARPDRHLLEVGRIADNRENDVALCQIGDPVDNQRTTGLQWFRL